MSDDATPRDGYPAQSNPFDSASRRPRAVTDRPSGRIYPRPDSEQDTGSDELAIIIDARIRRKMRKLWAVAGTLATMLLGVGGGSVKVYGDNRAVAERQAVRIEVLEREVARLRDRESQPIYAPWPAAQPTPPAPKGPHP